MEMCKGRRLKLVHFDEYCLIPLYRNQNHRTSHNPIMFIILLSLSYLTTTIGVAGSDLFKVKQHLATFPYKYIWNLCTTYLTVLITFLVLVNIPLKKWRCGANFFFFFFFLSNRGVFLCLQILLNGV